MLLFIFHIGNGIVAFVVVVRFWVVNVFSYLDLSSLSTFAFQCMERKEREYVQE